MYRFYSLYFLVLIPVWIFIFFRKEKKEFIKFSSIKLIRNRSKKSRYKHKLGRYLTLIALLMFTVALARPQSGSKKIENKKKGIDIVLALDVSGSMESVDIKPNRLEVAKEVLNSFIAKRSDDRIALSIFAGGAYTRIPLTTDYEVIKNSINSLSKKDVNERGTAIGMGLAVAVNRLKNSEAKTKIVILVTDGQNNAGNLSPQAAVELAKKIGIKVYTVGVGTDYDVYLQKDFFGNVEEVKQEGGLDEETLKYIAENTAAKYYRADSKKSFENIFDEIDKLEKTKLNVKNIFEYREMYKSWILFGLFFLILAFICELIYIKIP